MDHKVKEGWRDHKEDMENMRRRRRDQFAKVIKEFRDLGFEVEKISPYQFRFNDSIDIYPSNKKYHNLKTKVRGEIRGVNVGKFLRKHFNLTA